MYRDKDEAEIEGMPNQWLVQLESNPSKPTPDSINDTLLWFQTGALYNSLLRGFIQQPMETGAENLSQTLGRTQGVLGKSEGV